ncbi:hypothetical protein QTP88_018881 [Uroleucon formosanum]
MPNYSNIPNLPTYSQFRATETWQALVDHFRSGMPLKSHRYQLWFRDNCFTGFEAVDWMYNEASSGKLQYLFNKGVTRQQIVALMNKFYEADIFKAVSTTSTKFKDKSELYEFALPKNMNKTISKGSVLSSLNVFLMNKPQSLSPQPKRSEKVISSHRMKSYSMENVAMNTYLNENHKIANFIIQNLRNILKSFNMDDFLNTENLNKQWIIMNIYNQDYNVDGLFPHWVKSAMDSLTSDIEMNECTYPGFKADVYSVVKDYFLNSEEPLIPISFYEIFISILVVVERYDHMCNKNMKHTENNNSTQLSTNMCWETDFSTDHSKSCIVNKCFDISGQQVSSLSRSSVSSCSSTSFFESCEIEQSKMEHKPLNISHKYSKPKLTRTISSPEISVKSQSYYQRNIEKIMKRKIGRTISNNSINPKNLNELDDSFYSDEYGFKNKPLKNDKFVCPSTSGYVNFGLFQSEKNSYDDTNGFDLDMAISTLHKLIDITQMDHTQVLKHQSFNGLNEKSSHLGILLYQLLSLCLPPLNRAKLQVFLKFVSHLSSTYTEITDKLCCAVLRQNINQFEYDCLATDVVKFLLHSQKLIFLPIKTDSILSEKFNSFSNDDKLFKDSMHYCLRISDKEFEKQRSTESKEALIELLDQIISSTSMSNKEKSKRIKLFQKMYPDVYQKRSTLLEQHKKRNTVLNELKIKNLRI